MAEKANRKSAGRRLLAHQQRKQAVPQRGLEDSSESVSPPSEGRVAAEGEIGRPVGCLGAGHGRKATEPCQNTAVLRISR